MVTKKRKTKTATSKAWVGATNMLDDVAESYPKELTASQVWDRSCDKAVDSLKFNITAKPAKRAAPHMSPRKIRDLCNEHAETIDKLSRTVLHEHQHHRVLVDEITMITAQNRTLREDRSKVMDEAKRERTIVNKLLGL